VANKGTMMFVYRGHVARSSCAEPLAGASRIRDCHEKATHRFVL
jgi:hypothetical protein